ncbi:MAG: hypothetical protein Q7R79_01905 [bacterium]|nr:hypothetical protein [bacterium]
MSQAQKNEQSNIGRGGDAGEVFIAARKIIGNGKITADGGDGSVGGKGGRVTLISEDNHFAGIVSVKGGKSLSVPEKWWESTWFQVIALLGALAGIVGLILFI